MTSEGFDIAYTSDIENVRQLTGIFNSYMKQVPKIENFPEHTISVLLVYSFIIATRAYEELRFGYLGVAMIILRSAIENLVTGMYLYEFPLQEVEIRDKIDDNCSAILMKRMDKEYKQMGWFPIAALAKIEKEGNHFPNNKWKEKIYDNLMKELSTFVHMNPSYTRWLLAGGDQKYIIGPNFLEPKIEVNAIYKIIEVMLYDIYVINFVFNNDIKLHYNSEIKKIAEKFNHWKESYT